MTFVTVFAGGIAIQNTNWAIWFWQLGSCILAIFFVYFMCPETVGKTRELSVIDVVVLTNVYKQWRRSIWSSWRRVTSLSTARQHRKRLVRRRVQDLCTRRRDESAKVDELDQQRRHAMFRMKLLQKVFACHGNLCMQVSVLRSNRSRYSHPLT
jgi:hypothetical protein